MFIHPDFFGKLKDPLFEDKKSNRLRLKKVFLLENPPCFLFYFLYKIDEMRITVQTTDENCPMFTPKMVLSRSQWYFFHLR